MRWPDGWKGPYWEPRDLWIGAYWDHDIFKVKGEKHTAYETLTIYVCLVPCFPIRVFWCDNADPARAKLREVPA